MPDRADLPAAPLGPEQRDAAIEQLTRAFAGGLIELDDFERRTEQAVRAATPQDLARALDGLVAKAPEVGSRLELGPDRPRGSGWTVAVLSGTNRRGRWFPAQRHRVFALMGGARIDFRDAEIPHGVTDVTVYALWGGVEIIVPDDVDAAVDGMALLGGLTHHDAHPTPLENQAHRLRIHVRALMAGVEVQVRQEGESGKAYRKRLKEQRLMRLEGKTRDKGVRGDGS